MKLATWFLWAFNFIILIAAIVLISCKLIGEVGYIILTLSIAGLISVGKYIKLSIGGATLQVEDDDNDKPSVESTETPLISTQQDPKLK